MNAPTSSAAPANASSAGFEERPDAVVDLLRRLGGRLRAGLDLDPAGRLARRLRTSASGVTLGAADATIPETLALEAFQACTSASGATIIVAPPIEATLPKSAMPTRRTGRILLRVVTPTRAPTRRSSSASLRLTMISPRRAGSRPDTTRSGLNGGPLFDTRIAGANRVDRLLRRRPASRSGTADPRRDPRPGPARRARRSTRRASAPRRSRCGTRSAARCSRRRPSSRSAGRRRTPPGSGSVWTVVPAIMATPSVIATATRSAAGAGPCRAARRRSWRAPQVVEDRVDARAVLDAGDGRRRGTRRGRRTSPPSWVTITIVCPRSSTARRGARGSRGLTRSRGFRSARRRTPRPDA